MRRAEERRGGRPADGPWWRDAAVYRVDVASFADSDGDGVGDLAGVRSRLGYLELLGVDALRLTPPARSPVADPVTGPRDVDRPISDPGAVDALVADAHAHGLRVVVDLVPDVRDSPEDLERTLRSWLDRGADGVRVAAPRTAEPGGADGVHDLHRAVRAVLDGYRGDRVAVGEVRVTDDVARCVRADELHLAVDPGLADAGFDADRVCAAIQRFLGAVAAAGAPATWTLSDHDLVRPVTRYGGGEVGTRRARAMGLVELALPGAVHLDNGEELGLPEVRPADAEPPDAEHADAEAADAGRAGRARDGSRVPLPWECSGPSLGFSTADRSWLPPPWRERWAELSVEAQLEDPESTLSLYRRALDLRRSDAAAGDELEWFGAPAGCFAFRRRDGGLVCALNAADRPVPMPPGEVLLASGPLPDESELPPDTAVWLS